MADAGFDSTSHGKRSSARVQRLVSAYGRGDATADGASARSALDSWRTDGMAGQRGAARANARSGHFFSIAFDSDVRRVGAATTAFRAALSSPDTWRLGGGACFCRATAGLTQEKTWGPHLIVNIESNTAAWVLFEWSNHNDSGHYFYPNELSSRFQPTQRGTSKSMAGPTTFSTVTWGSF